MHLSYTLDSEELARLQTPIVVEQWDKKNFGRVKRLWLHSFNEADRKRASRLQKLFYQWYLIKGLPQEHTFKPRTVCLIHRLVEFFASI